MVDRSIVPGASQEFSSFSASTRDAPMYIKNNPDIAIGIANAVFMAGYLISMIVISNMVHYIKWKKLIVFSFSIWNVSVLMSAIAGHESVDSLYLFLLSRMLTGVAESSIYIISPILFQDRGGIHSGLWLSINIAMVPLGLAVGYILGSLISNAIHWSYCFYLLFILGLSLLVAFLFIQDNVNNGFLCSKKTEKYCYTKSTTWIKDLQACFRSKVFVYLILADSVEMAIFSIIGIFGGAIVLALGIFDNELNASTSMGIILVIAGIFGSSFGGIVMDKALEDNQKVVSSSNKALCIVLPLLFVGSSMSTLCWFATLIRELDRHIYLGLIGLALFFGCSVQSCITYAELLSVDKYLRPNALAYSRLCRHILGDIPAPIIFGFLKDKLAPGCNINSKGFFTDPEKCLEQKNGLLNALAIAFCYLFIFLLFVGLAYKDSLFAWKNEEKLKKQENQMILQTVSKNDVEITFI